MKTINRLFLAGIIIASVFMMLASCSKQTDEPGGSSNTDYYVRCKIDGVDMKFDAVAQGWINLNSDTSSLYVTDIVGQQDATAGDKNTLVLLMGSSHSLSSGITYTNYETTAVKEEKIELNHVTHYDEDGMFFASWEDDFASTAIVSDTKVVFTDISAKYLKGMFSGTIYKEINGSSEKHAVTNGEFYVERIL